jgi:hypothetical protein
MRLAIVSSRNLDACEAQALAADIQEEIRFLKYRLEVLEGRQSSPARDSHIKATIARLNTLAPPEDPPAANPVPRAA